MIMKNNKPISYRSHSLPPSRGCWRSLARCGHLCGPGLRCVCVCFDAKLNPEPDPAINTGWLSADSCTLNPKLNPELNPAINSGWLSAASCTLNLKLTPELNPAINTGWLSAASCIGIALVGQSLAGGPEAFSATGTKSLV